MTRTPSSYLFTSAEECCQVHFGWDLQTCRKQSLGRPKWYPDIDGNGGCKNDGNEPLRFKRYSDYLFDTLEECCDAYYDWNLNACLHPEIAPDPCSADNIFRYYEVGYNEDFLLESEVGYYPVWDDEELYCVKNPNDATPYMDTTPSAWKHQTLAECCWTNFQWVWRDCMGVYVVCKIVFGHVEDGAVYRKGVVLFRSGS